MEKESRIIVAARIKISCANVRVHTFNFEKPDESSKAAVFMIKPTLEEIDQVKKLRVFDHRPKVVVKAEIVEKIRCGKFSKEELDSAMRSLIKEVSQPALVRIVVSISAGRRISSVGFYPTRAVPEALFSEGAYMCRCPAEFEIERNESLWSWKSKISSKDGSRHEVRLVALTDEAHSMYIRKYKDGLLKRNSRMIIIGSKIGFFDLPATKKTRHQFCDSDQERSRR